MKLKQEYVLREVAGTWVVLPLKGADLDGMIKLNASGALLWQGLEQGADRSGLTALLTSEYEVTAQQAEEDIDAFLALLQRYGCVEE